jgi:hypothetical protein
MTRGGGGREGKPRPDLKSRVDGFIAENIPLQAVTHLKY